MRPEDEAVLPPYDGIRLDRRTGKAYLDDGTDIGITFEPASWMWPWLNPTSFATAETARQVLAWAHRAAPPTLAVTIGEQRRLLGPFTRALERRVVLTDLAGRSASFSAGLLAVSMIRDGEAAAARAFRIEWRSVGLQF